MHQQFVLLLFEAFNSSLRRPLEGGPEFGLKENEKNKTPKIQK